MYLKLISLTNFRNYRKLKIKLEKRVTVLKGDNAQGKTNFLESIFFLATGKPIKNESDEEVVKFQESVVSVEGEIENLSGNNAISTIIQKTETGLRKRFLVNGIPRRLLDYSGNLVVVYFRPEDIDLVTGSPGLRREYIDQTISQIDRGYRKILSTYHKIITQKNKLLKLIREGVAKGDELLYWNQEQLKLGIKIQEKRRSFFEKINSYEKRFGEFEYKYLPNPITLQRLEEYAIREIPAAVCLIGPHRDDFKFFLHPPSLRSAGRRSGNPDDSTAVDLSRYGSRGEQRTAVLDLKITELIFYESVLGERPVLLLDDIFSELDISHRQHVLDLSSLQQTIISTVEYDKYLEEGLKSAQIFTVDNGVIKG